MLSWIKTNPILAAIGLLVALAIVAGVFSCVDKRSRERDEVHTNLGVTKERAASQGEVLNRVQNAQDAVANPSAADSQRVCEKYDRNCTPSN